MSLKSNRAWRLKYPERYLLQLAKRRAKKLGVAFSLIETDLSVPKRCPLLDIPLFMGTGKSGDNSPTLDRIHPRKGYVAGNVMVISNRANQIKSNATPDEIIQVGAALRHFLNLRGRKKR